MNIKLIFKFTSRQFLVLAFINLLLFNNADASGISGIQQSLKSETISAAAKISGTVVGCEGSALNVRDGAWGNIIGALNNGAGVTIVATDGDWYKIEYNGGISYVYKSYVSTNQGSVVTASQPSSSPGAAASSGTVVGCEGSGLNVRDGAWGNIIGSLANGAGMSIIGEEGDWYKISYNGGTGYVYKSYVSKGGAATSTGNTSANGSSSGTHLTVPLTGQPDGYTCGPTSLSMALQYYGINKSIHPELANLCNTTTDGTPSTDNIASAARALGLSGSYSTSGDINWLKEVTASGKPVVVNVAGGVWSGGHYIVVTGVKDGTVYVNDPAWGFGNEYGHSGNKITFDINTFSSIWGNRWNHAAVITK